MMPGRMKKSCVFAPRFQINSRQNTSHIVRRCMHIKSHTHQRLPHLASALTMCVLSGVFSTRTLRMRLYGTVVHDDASTGSKVSDVDTSNMEASIENTTPPTSDAVAARDINNHVQITCDAVTSGLIDAVPAVGAGCHVTSTARSVTCNTSMAACTRMTFGSLQNCVMSSTQRVDEQFRQ